MLIVDQILSFDQSQEEFYFLKLEALWILSNFAGVDGDAETLKLIFMSSFAAKSGTELNDYIPDYEEI